VGRRQADAVYEAERRYLRRVKFTNASGSIEGEYYVEDLVGSVLGSLFCGV
jgi:hypothetical protein